MILDKNVKIKVYNNNYKYYKDKGYNSKIGDIISVDINDLPKQSTVEINVKCDVCDKIDIIQYRRYINNKKNKNFFVCSLSCAQEKIKITRQEKYDDPNFSNIKKRKETCLNKYGNENYKNIRKRYNTCIDKYGYKSPIESEIIKEKRKETYILYYGEDHPMKNEKIRIKKQKTCFDIYGNENYININKIKETTRKNKNLILNKKYDINIIGYDENGDYILNCDICNNNFSISNGLLNKRHLYNVKNICTICNPVDIKRSDMENNISNFIKEKYNDDIILNDRHLGKELDIYIPELKIAFEFNGLWWHNELYKDKNFHMEKTELCEKNGIQLIHIWEDDWIYKQDIVKSMILNKLGKTPNKIYARKTEVREINDNKLVREFLEKNHIQGFVGSRIKIGLFYDNELVSLMTFGKRRIAMGNKKNNDDEYELLRFCSKLNTNVVGGANKLFKYFIKNYNPKEIITYADRSISNGNLYDKLGFKYIGKTYPNYYYIVDGIRHHRFNFRKDKLIREGYNPSLTEHQIMLNRNIYRIYNSGNLKFIYSF